MLALRDAKHALVMITGDATLTAAAVASELELVTKPCAVLRKQQWETVDGQQLAPFDQFGGPALADYDLCVPGTTAGRRRRV